MEIDNSILIDALSQYDIPVKNMMGVAPFPEISAFLLVAFHSRKVRIASYDIETLFYRRKKYKLYVDLELETHEYLS